MYLPGLLRSRLAPVWRWTWRICQPIVVLMLAFGGALLVGQIPVNRDFQAPAEGVEIFVYVDSAHSKIVVPLRNEVRDWSPWFSTSDFKSLTGKESYVAFDWGDREFFLNTQRWKDIKADLTAWAMLWPTDTVMHVTMKTKPEENHLYRSVTITPEGYAKMVEFIESHFRLDGSARLGGTHPRLIPGRGFVNHDAFYEGLGTYSLFYTCNAWTGDALQVAGVRTGCWTPFPVGIMQTDD
ncbi:DUF2459 domain-containing protein [Aeoliella mucimassa]|uniref:TIGR02117 family protein n=1 Tax=Aeoliella mucimassa TaxID=2527972 RepID=A0A518AIL3_9BACT|nr:DUF2459 domain-containing protein [Aeoliella mucimassa]QDU54504.1 hypothetical protein Pan181_06860 [Aeoliella mucimassa]